MANFNSRPSARGDGERIEKRIFELISIHAPPRGATHTRRPASFPPLISIHAPPRGATTARGWGKKRWKFQFTPLREGRQRCRSFPASSSHFNSRPSARGDGSGDWQDDHQGNFNSRPSARGDLSLPSATAAASDFNSRPSARGDFAKVKPYDKEYCISIHAPPRGATVAIQILCGLKIFQFTPLREGRPVGGFIFCTALLNFNSRPSARGDPQFPPGSFPS